MAPQKDEILERIEGIDESFLDAIEEDDRLRSGVPELQRATDLDFIRMTGITRGASTERRNVSGEALPPEPDEADALSFFERGVADVDAAMAPPALEQTGELNKDIVVPSASSLGGASPATPLIADLKDVIEELVREEPAPPAGIAGAKAPKSPATGPAPAEDWELDAETDPLPGADLEELLARLPEPAEAGSWKIEDLSSDLVRADLRPEAVGLDSPPSDIPAWMRGDETSSIEDFSPSADAEDECAVPQIEPEVEDVVQLGEPEVQEPPVRAEQPVFLEEPSLAQPLPLLDPPVLADTPPLVELPVLADTPPLMEPPVLADTPLPAEPPVFEEPPPIAEPPVHPVMTRPVLPGYDPMAGLAEAEHLLQALESQPRDREPSEFPPRVGLEPSSPAGVEIPREPASPRETEPAIPSIPVKAEGNEAGEERDASVYRRPSTKHRRRRSNRGNRGWRRMVRLGTAVAVLAILSAGGAVGYLQLTAILATPEQNFDKANALQSKHEYAEAVLAYQRFAQANPEHPRRADAQFNAAFCEQLIPANTFDEKQAVATRAVELLEQFVKDNPAHAKVPRAKIRIGILDFDMGRYDAAVELLQDPTLQQSDPQGALPALRTLARARWKLGQFDQAISAYLQAASVTDNCTADQDYDELGDLYRSRAEHADNAEEKRRFEVAAVENWNLALRMSTTDPAARGKIREKRKWVCERLGITDEAAQALVHQTESDGSPAAAPAAAPAPAPAAENSAAAPATESGGPAPAEPGTLTAETAAPDPGAETTYPGAAAGGTQ